MLRNTIGQKWRVLAFDRSNNQVVTGDADNITAKISIDYGTRTDLTDVNPVEAEDGFYYFDLAQSETEGHLLEIFPESTTTNVQVIGVPGYFNTIPVDAPTTELPSDLVEFVEAIGPRRVKTKEVEIEAQSPIMLQRLKERIGPKPVTLNQFPLTRVSPKNAQCPCETQYDTEYE